MKQINYSLKLIAAILCFSLFLLTTASLSLAQQGYPVEAGSSKGAAVTLPGAVAVDDFVMIEAKNLRSYCCKLRSTSFNDAPYFEDVSLLGTTQTSTSRGTDEPAYPTIEDHSSPGNTRLCFIAQTPGSFAFTMKFDNGPAGTVKAKCSETTLFGNFNTVVTELDYLELVNTLQDSSISGTIHATDTVANTSVISQQPFTVPAGGRFDVSIHDAAGTAAFGTLVVAHDGPPGSLQATNSQYQITSASPFAFELVSQQKLTER